MNIDIKNIEKLKKLIDDSQKIVIIQADNPDSDSLGSALILESIIEDLGKTTVMYCGVDIPNYIKYIDGWDRVVKDFPNNFDAAVFVDVSTLTLFDKLAPADISKIASKPSAVIDHHAASENAIELGNINLIDSNRASTGELLYQLSNRIGYKMNTEICNLVASTILGDTQGLTNDLANSNTYRIMAELIDNGVNRPQLEEKRKSFSKMTEEIFKYKAELIRRTQFANDNKIAYVVIPQSEINTYSPLYNPSALVIPEMLQTENVDIALSLKQYNDGKVTGAIRCNPSAPFAKNISEKFGGGGHEYASGFKVLDKKPVDIINEIIQYTNNLLLK